MSHLAQSRICGTKPLCRFRFQESNISLDIERKSKHRQLFKKTHLFHKHSDVLKESLKCHIAKNYLISQGSVLSLFIYMKFLKLIAKLLLSLVIRKLNAISGKCQARVPCIFIVRSRDHVDHIM